MQILAVELRRLELVLVRPLGTSSATLDRRPISLVRMITDEGDGLGECAALEGPFYTEEDADGAERMLATHLVPRLLAGHGANRAQDPPGAVDMAPPGEIDPEPGDLGRWVAQRLGALRDVKGQHMAKAAIEMALLDAALRSEGRSLSSYLGATRTTVLAGATVGLGTATETVLRAVGEAVSAGYRRVKCKIAPGRDVAVLAAVREAHPDLLLSADANGSYRLGDPRHRAALIELDRAGLGLLALEQPLAPDDLVGHAELCAQLETPIMLDESIASRGALDAALALHACDAVSVKPARLGGLLIGRSVVERCATAGVGAAIGGLLETGIGRAAALALGALEGCELPGELGASDRYFAEDLTEAHRLVGGRLAVPGGPGLGVELRDDVVAETTVRITSFRAA